MTLLQAVIGFLLCVVAVCALPTAMWVIDFWKRP